MNYKCACGGQMQHLSDNPVYFRRKCDKCGRINKQRKRVKRRVLKLSGNMLVIPFDQTTTTEGHL